MWEIIRSLLGTKKKKHTTVKVNSENLKQLSENKSTNDALIAIWNRLYQKAENEFKEEWILEEKQLYNIRINKPLKKSEMIFKLLITTFISGFDFLNRVNEIKIFNITLRWRTC